MTDGERRFSCNLHVYLFYEPRKKTAIRILLQSSARLSCGKDQPMCLTWFDESLAWVLRKSLFYEFTTSACNSPLLKPFYGGLRGRFPCFAPMRLPFTSKIVEHSRYLPLRLPVCMHKLISSSLRLGIAWSSWRRLPASSGTRSSSRRGAWVCLKRNS